MNKTYFLGLDLGKSRDFSALAVVERSAVRTGWDAVQFADVFETRVRLVGLERIRLGTSYPRVVERVRSVALKAADMGSCVLVVDGTGVGAPVVDSLRELDLPCNVVSVTITGGERATRVSGGWNVPKRDLMAGLRMMIERADLEIAAGLRERRTLLDELIHFGKASTQTHDDLVMAAALACWKVRERDVGLRGQRLCY
jgi:hypothetical protein